MAYGQGDRSHYDHPAACGSDVNESDYNVRFPCISERELDYSERHHNQRQCGCVLQGRRLHPPCARVQGHGGNCPKNIPGQH